MATCDARLGHNLGLRALHAHGFGLCKLRTQDSSRGTRAICADNPFAHARHTSLSSLQASPGVRGPPTARVYEYFHKSSTQVMACEIEIGRVHLVPPTRRSRPSIAPASVLAGTPGRHMASIEAGVWVDTTGHSIR